MSFIYIGIGKQCSKEWAGGSAKRVLANRYLYAYSKSYLVNRLWVPLIV